MTPHTVLSERQRVVKRQIREENRVHRKFERPEEKPLVSIVPPTLTENGTSILGTDDNITQVILGAYCELFTRKGSSMKVSIFYVSKLQFCDE